MRAVIALVVALLTLGFLNPAHAEPPHVTFHGATIAVPASWPVYDLTKDPTRCVRFDQHAVYLGHPGTDQDCPAHLIGRTTALLAEPNDGTSTISAPDADSGSTQAVSANGQVLLTASYGAGGSSAATAALRGTALRAGAPRPQPAAAPSVGPTPAATAGSGYGFDTCAAPSKATMKAWSGTAPYRNVAVYIGGINRACGDGNLNSSWISAAHSDGYHVIPTYVGRQAPCSGVGVPVSSNPTLATTNGRNAAVNAIHGMQRIGFGQHEPIYLDIEQYSGNTTCQRSVLRFIDAWVSRLHSSGYLAGVYGSNFNELVARHNTSGFHDPDAIWIGRWNGKAAVYGDPVVPDHYWASHQRIHQYRGPHDQQYGGVTLNIDTDYVDGPVG
jgi:hypothetical protein